ncbi:hypothetical protein CRG98_003721 [Punica granatum]|uniref:Uncharacterized protein n=1 Tax=Punica granatum TaxID=22663 RepID=A0A2I0L597_PUNGR|nr:hypothetical protein CRG98_003721 [Punica granatum]
MCRGFAISDRSEGARVPIGEWPFMKRGDPWNMCIRVKGEILWDPPNQGYVDSTPFRGESRSRRVEESLFASKTAEPLLIVASRGVPLFFRGRANIAPNFCLGREMRDDLAGSPRGGFRPSGKIISFLSRRFPGGENDGSRSLTGSAVRTRMWTLVGAHMRAFGSRGLGVSTFPWGRVTDTRERRSRHLSFYNPKVEGG